MTYKAVGFDYGGVLRGLPGGIFVDNVSAELGIDREAWRTAFFHHNKKMNRVEISWNDLMKLVVDELGKPEKLDEVIRVSDEYSNNDDINQEVLAIIDKLRAQNLKVGLLSNNTAEALDEITEKGLIPHLDVVQVSAITGLVKPEPEAFKHLADELGVKIEELIFIDDSPKSLSTADECGFTPILFESAEQLRTDLRKLGLDV